MAEKRCEPEALEEREQNWNIDIKKKNKDVTSEAQGLSEKMMSETDTRADDWHTDVCQGIMMAYFLVIAVIYPLYAPGGYLRIGDVKYEFFRNVSLATIAVMAAVILLTALCRWHSGWLIGHYRQMSVTDWFAYGYFVVVMVSYLNSAYKEDALWGAEGWHMGAVTQMTFVLVYFFFSRYFHKNTGWIGIWLVASAVVFLLGICNRYSVYPIAMEGQTDTFISTLGNINWFCGYWSVAASVGIALYWCSDGGWSCLLTGIYSAVAMLAGVTQGSSSAYLVFGVLCVGLFMMSLRNRVKLFRFLELCIMFAAVCQLGRILRYMPGLYYNYGLADVDGRSRITAALLDSNLMLWGLGALLLCYMLLRMAGSETNGKKYGRRSTVIAGVCAVLVIAIICAAGTVNRKRIVFNEDWGNGRGAAWNCGIDAYRGMDLIHKLAGAGPDCFADYVYEVPELAEKLADRFINQRLTNAHNELLTQLVNVGALGFLCYAGIFFSAFLRCLRRADTRPILYVCALGILAYTAHGMVSFQQVLNTPYIFIVMGIGERYCRSTLYKAFESGDAAECPPIITQ